MGKGESNRKQDVRSQVVTIHLAKYTHRQTFKKKAPRACREIKKFAQKAMGTKEVKLMPEVNKYVWSKGVRKTPKRIRVKLNRKKNEDEDADGMITYVELVEVPSFKGLQTE